MARNDLNAIVRYLQQLAGSSGVSGAGDAELLERYVHCRDESAFELLLWRHGALVLNVCRRLLSCPEDVEDAFQATFLAFVRKAGSISRRDSVAGWLYKVAYRVALEARERARKTAAREKAGGEILAVQPAADPLWSDVRQILDEELNRLPECLRLPIVLCYLEGKSNEEAARQLGCPAGTIYSRLARGREKLRRRLQQRGVTLSVAMLAAALTEQAAEAMPSSALMAATLRNTMLFAAGKTVGGISASAATLAEGVLRSMLVTKIRLMASMVLLAGLFAAGGVLARHSRNSEPQPEERPAEELKERPVVSVIRPAPGGLPRTSRSPGSVVAIAQQRVYPIVSGYLKRFAVDMGDRVKKGDVLAEVETPLLDVEHKQTEVALKLELLQVEAAKAQIEMAVAQLRAASERIKSCEAKLKSDEAYADYRKKQAERYRGLIKDRAIPQSTVDEQEDQLRAAIAAANASRQALQSARSDVGINESKVRSAKVALEMALTKVEIARSVVGKTIIQRDRAVLRANIDGVVASRSTNTGDFVFASDGWGRQPLLTVLRTDPIRIRVDAVSSDVPFIHAGNSVHLHISALPDAKFPGCTVSRTGVVVDENSGAMAVEIDVPNPKTLLLPGMAVIANIVLDKKAPAGALAVPEKSVVRLEGEYYVYVAREGKAHLTPVQVSYSYDRKMEIVSGLRAADRIVVDPRGLKGEIVAVEIKKLP